ncbi:unnamed protein product [Protopolystoma xenopodis]|uniref:Uncharacterized protein n=1 Tax=Protopolystoma xenopodis TaxID=117903 RepID=A0A448XMJ3_9PLAT|nr:unnamed protein product [Protopolystoma xenopodis]
MHTDTCTTAHAVTVIGSLQLSLYAGALPQFSPCATSGRYGVTTTRVSYLRHGNVSWISGAIRRTLSRLWSPLEVLRRPAP